MASNTFSRLHACFRARGPLVFALACVAACAGTVGIVACSGTSTGTGAAGDGGTAASGGKGVFGSGGSGATGSGYVIPTTCTAAVSDDTCSACLKQECCSQTVACGTNTECTEIYSCATQCDSSDNACIQGCVQAHPNGQQAIGALVDCEEGSACQSPCEGGSTSTSGGTSGSAGSSGSSGSSGTSGGSSDGCLENPAQDPTLCPNLPSQQVVRDCPAGPPPGDGCVISPSGLTGIYCCAS